MSYSYDYCKEHIKSKHAWGYEDVDFSKAVEYDISNNLNDEFLTERQYDILTGGSIKTKIIYTPDCKQFHYVTSERRYTDGTVCFVAEIIEELLRRVFICDTYYKPAGLPENNDFLTYTIGNPIVIEEVDNKFAPEGKPWMTDRVTVMLPIFFERRRNDF